MNKEKYLHGSGAPSGGAPGPCKYWSYHFILSNNYHDFLSKFLAENNNNNNNNSKVNNSFE